MTPTQRGSLFMVLSMVGFAIEDALFKAAVTVASPGVATVVFGVTGLGLFLALAASQGSPLWSEDYLRRPLLVRSGIETVGRLFYFLALAYVPLSLTTTILQATPLVVTLGAALILGEAVGRRRWIAMGVGFAGVLLILRPSGEGFDATVLFAVIGTLGFAGRDLATRASPARVTGAQLGILGFAVVTLSGLILLVFEDTHRLPDAASLGLLIGTAVAGVTAYAFLTGAMRSGDISVVAPFRYSRLLVALLIAFVVFGERPAAIMYVGAALIVGSGAYTLWRAGRRDGTGVAPENAVDPRPSQKDSTE